MIHVAGILKIGSLAELPVSELGKALEINLLGVCRVNQQFLPLLLEQKGRVVILNSEVARTIRKALESNSSRSSYVIKTDVSRILLDMLPVKWADKIIAQVLS